MQKALKDMWIIIACFTLLNIYGLIYSVTLFLLYKQNRMCTTVNSLFTFFMYLINRFVIYIIWTYPIIFALWPKERTWIGNLKQNQEVKVENNYKP